MSMSLRELLKEDFWVDLRRAIFQDEGIGFFLCAKWNIQAIIKLEEIGVGKNFIEKAVQSRNLFVSESYSLNSHRWLETENDGERFIADGTAGQIDPNYPLGFYGFISKASESLRRIYNYSE